MEDKFYITTPIYYVNDVPHIGHTCTTVAADIIARYHKLLGQKVFFLTGTDEHGAKVAEAAKKENCAPGEFCDRVSQSFASIWPKLGIEYDYFIRTTNPDHKQIVTEVLQKIYQKGDIYKAKYEGFYCIGCEKFVNEGDLVNNCCPFHPNRPVERQSEDNYFFRLSKYIPTLIEAIENDKHPLHYQVSPESKKSEVLARLKTGVSDLSISRAGVSWGIPVPWDNSQTIYVWVDALFNYYTALKITKNESFWPADLHLIAKDILWFHTVIWEALLIAADLPLPKEIFIHNFYLVNSQKMSKSLGNVISPQQLIEKYGVDAARYLVASSFPAFDDSDVGLKKFDEKYTADLANGLGNLIARIAKLCENSSFEFKNTALGLDSSYKQNIENFRLNEILENIWQMINDSNKQINEAKLWELNGQPLSKALQNKVDAIRQIAFYLKPFMPETSQKILDQFQGPKIKSGPALFPRLKYDK